MTVNINWNKNRQKNNKMGYDPGKPLGHQIMNQIHSRREEGLSPRTKKDYERKIYSKIQSGKKLTPDEMSYLARTNPAMYQKALRAQFFRRALESKLKSCRSKEEAQDIFAIAIGSIDENDPDRDIIIAALNDAYSEFKKSKEYKTLPETKKGAGGEETASLEFGTNDSGYQEIFLTKQKNISFTVNG